MQLELVNAIAAVITLALLAVTTIAGITQLRHLRASNELAAVLSIERDFRSPEIQAALLYAQNELPARMEQAAYRAELDGPGYVDPATHPEMILCNWFNRTGSFVRAGFLKEELFLNSFGRLVTYYWELLGPVVAVLRRRRGDGQYADFEYLAFRAQQRRRSGRTRRVNPQALAMPVDDPWPHDAAPAET